MEKIAVSALISGAVQGVGFRYTTQRMALALSLTGYVTNLDDGRVEVRAYGPPGAVHSLLEWLARGPSSAQVTEVVTSSADPWDGSGFLIL